MIDSRWIGGLVFAPVACYALAAISAVVFARLGRDAQRWAPSLLIAAGALTGLVLAVTSLTGNVTASGTAWSVAPLLSLSYRLDALAAFFLLVISLPALATAWYGIGYLNAPRGDTATRAPHADRAATDALLAAFLASMILVVLANGIFAFLMAWELMAVVSFFLVLGNGHSQQTRRASYVYLVMTHIGTGFLTFAFLLLFRHAGSLDFDALRASAATLDDTTRDIVFLLALVGLGTKAGLIPLHVWLPRAHPAAPSHVSALMSGVMVKTALYGIIRMGWELAGPGPAWWGGLLLVVGAISAVLGILYALMERDMKRVLAFSTVEHVGIITLGLGAAMMLGVENRPAAALAFLAALIHLLNHALFKGLMFLGAGAVQTATGTRDVERLGGLIKSMPRTSIAMLVGAVAIAALPPLNGFVGEWLLFQALLQVGVVGNAAFPATFSAVAAAALALTGALALACFVRLYGIAFLGEARSAAARHVHEVPASMQAGMGLLAALCILFGILPGIVVRLLQPVTSQLVGATATPALSALPSLDASLLTGAYAPLGLVIGLLILGIAPWIIARLLGGPGRSRIAPPWVCGVELQPRMQYTATGFAKPIRLIFQAAIRPERSVIIERSSSPHVVSAVRYEESVHPVFERHLYERGVGLLIAASHRIRLLQSGSLRAYLAYLFATLVVVLILTR